MDIPSRTILKVLSLTAGFIGVLMLGYMARHELLWIGTAFFLAIALNPAVDRLSRLMPGRNRLLGVVAVFLCALLLLAVLLVSFVPPLIQQSNQLGHNLPQYTDDLINGHGFVSDQIRQYNLVDRVKESQAQLVSYASSAGTQFFEVLRGVFSSVVAGVTIIGLTFFMCLEGPSWVSAVWQAVPSRRRPHTKQLVGQMYNAVTGYVNGNLLTSLIAATITAIMLAIVGVPAAIPLGIFVGIMDLLPLVGATIGALVVITVALFTSATAAVIMAVYFVIYQQVENHALQPVVYGRTVQISPLLVLIAVLIGAAVMGLIGAIIAIPFFASLQILVKDYAERHLARS
jgi:predicted PurR-regulated permease PerM